MATEIKSIITLRDAQKEKLAMNSKQQIEWAKEDAEKARVASILQANPQIGVLMRNGKNIYYTYPVGTKGSFYKEAKDPATLIIDHG